MALAALGILAGCSGNRAKETSAKPVDETIAETNWELVALDGAQVPATKPAAAIIAFGPDGSIGGTAACNEGGSPMRWHQGRFAISSNVNTVPLPIFTVMRCLDDASSEIGNRFWNRMMTAQTWVRDGRTLKIVFKDARTASLRLLPPRIAADAQLPAGDRLALVGPGSTEGVSNRQLIAMFGQALARGAPLAEAKAVCLGLQGEQDNRTRDAPAFILKLLAPSIGLPVLPASKCSMDTVPRNAATREQAVLYTAKVEHLGQPITFMATAVFGNLGAKGTQYRLRSLRGGGFAAEPTGLTVLS
ncbi:META domain-containing protein [Qipengyuania thermophila]|uniref:META domain-containing protein n=1 Tax=Qipengyuania thermophila TaxID=2509361 RepID=UPI0013EA8315|nr:META domain-containing protein [Qipengyuania thermophila]